MLMVLTQETAAQRKVDAGHALAGGDEAAQRT